MNFRRIDLLLDTGETERNYGSAFSFENRFIGNYLRRRQRALKFETQGFTRAVIVGSQIELAKTFIEDKVLIITVPFNKEVYDSLDSLEKVEFFIEMYLAGLHKGNETYKLPVAEMEAFIADFRMGGYKNEWEYKSKTFKDFGIKAILNCRMTREAFTLSILIRKKDGVLLSKDILTTLPDEIIFDSQFKDLQLIDNELSVLDKFNRSIYTLDISPFA